MNSYMVIKMIEIRVSAGDHSNKIPWRSVSSSTPYSLSQATRVQPGLSEGSLRACSPADGSPLPVKRTQKSLNGILMFFHRRRRIVFCENHPREASSRHHAFPLKKQHRFLTEIYVIFFSHYQSSHL